MSLQTAFDVSGHTSVWTAFIGWFIGALPSIATLVTIIWLVILIVEKVTGKLFHELVHCAWRRVFPK